VTICHCLLCPSIGGLARESATAFRRIGGIESETTDGERGEFTVLVVGRVVLRKGDGLPSLRDVSNAVEDAALVGMGG
jgi:hypothetical protein